MVEQTWAITFEEPSMAPFLKLPNDVMEHVCRYLHFKRDKYEACLIHRDWTTAAQNVLWENIHFKSPESARLFLETISRSKKLALLVKDIYFAFMDPGSSDVTYHLHETLFQPIVRSKDERHVQSVLADTDLIAHFTRCCEKLVGLTCYGWQLSSLRFRSLASNARNLTSLSLIGAPPNYIHDLDMGLLSRLTTLRLDGEFRLHDHWAELLVKRATHLSVLQISLQDMERITTLQIICTHNGLPLTELVLTDATQLLDNHIPLMLSAFPKLTRFVLEGCKKITPASIFHAIKTCTQLSSLEIRADPATLESEQVTKVPSSPNTNLEASPCRVVLENMKITNEHLDQLSPYFTLLQTLGLKNCPSITNLGLEGFLEETAVKYLRVVHISNCPGVDSGLLSAIASIPAVVKSLLRFQLESCGPCDPHDVYDLCFASTKHNLRELTIVGDEFIQKSIIGTFARISMEPVVSCSLDRACIDALAHSTAPELRPVPQDRTVTGPQILLLASHLNMSVNELVDLLDQTHKETEDDMMNQDDIEGKLPRKKIISFDESINLKPSSSTNNRLYALQGRSSSQRPTTPALWSNDFQFNNFHTSVNGYEEDTSQDSTSSLADGTKGHIHSQAAIRSEDDENAEDKDNDDEEEYANISHSSYDDDQYNQEYTESSEHEQEVKQERHDKYNEQDEDEEEEYITSSHIIENNNDNNQQSANTDTRWEENSPVSPNARSEINIHLGGWGTSSTIVGGWNSQPSSSARNHASSNDFTIPPTSTSSNSSADHKMKDKLRQQQQQPESQPSWTGYIAEDYQSQWQQNGLQVIKTRVPSKAPKNKHNRNGPIIVDSDGWGVPTNNVRWGAVELSYSKDIIDQQRSTDFWKFANGEWQMLNNPGTDSSSVAAATHGASTTTVNHNSDDDAATLCDSGSSSLLFADIVAGTTSTSTTVLSDRGARMNGNSRYPKTSNRVNNNNYTTTTNTTTRINHDAINSDNNSNGNNNNNTNKNNIYTRPVARKRSTSLVSDDGAVNWVDTAGVTIKLDDTATTNYKSSINTQRFSRPGRESTRRSTPAPSRHSHGARDLNTTTTTTANPEAYNRWVEYTKSNDTSPSRRTPPPPPPPAQQQKQCNMMLIDTDNSTLSKPQFKGDVWDSISSLEVNPVTRPTTTSQSMLIPQEVTPPTPIITAAPVTTEVFSWSLPVPDESPNDLFHFTERQPGTITDAELDLQAQQQAQDTLINFDDILISSSKTNELMGDVMTPLSVITTPTLPHVSAVVTTTATENQVPDVTEANPSDAASTDSAPVAAATVATTDDATSDKVITKKVRIKIGENFQELCIAAVSFEEVKKQVEDFCKTYDCTELYDNVLSSIKPEWTRKHTKYILGKTRKAKKSASGSSSPPSSS